MRRARIFLFGYAGSGKTTLFRSLTGCTEESFDPFVPQPGIGRLADSRFSSITALLKAGKVVPAEAEFLDCKGFPSGTGFPEKSLRLLLEADLIVFVVANFAEGKDPAEDAENLLMELMFADTERVTTIQQAWRADAEKGKRHPAAQEKALADAAELLRQEKPLFSLPEEEKREVAGFDLITTRPVLVFVNGNANPVKIALPHLVSSAVSPEQEALYARIKEALDLICFFTVKGEIAQSWLVPRAIDAKTAAGHIHKDMEAGFIRAAVLPAEKFLALGSWQKAKTAGMLKFLGPHSHLSDGDVVEFYFHR